MATKAVVVNPFSNPLETAPLVKALRRLWRLMRTRMARRSAAPERALAVEERVALGPKKSLLVVRCHGQRFLVGVTADTVGPFVEIGAAARSRAKTPAVESATRPTVRKNARAGRIS